MNDTWQYQLTDYPVDLDVDATVFIVDLDMTPRSTVQNLHRMNRKVICYFSAGTLETWRPDAGKYPAELLGNPLEQYPDERWIDIREIDRLAPLIKNRIQRCAEKGFDGVDPDNLDGYLHDTGFRLSFEDQLRFNRTVARWVHEAGLFVGLKNDLAQIPQLVDVFDWATNEECFEYGECELLLPFIKREKPVVNVEYRLDPDEFCPEANRLGFFSMKKRKSLDAFRIPCR